MINRPINITTSKRQLLGAHALGTLSGRANVGQSVSSFSVVNITKSTPPPPLYKR